MKVVALAKATFKDFSEDEATWKAAALAYYTIFALPPLLMLLLQVASAIWDPGQVRQALTGEFQSLMGKDVAGQIQTMIASTEEKTGGGFTFKTVLSIAGLIFGATGAFVALQSALNTAWEVKPDPKAGGIKAFITKRLLSLGMVLGIAFLLLVSLAISSLMSAAGGALFGGMPEWLGRALNFVISFGVITLLFAAIFKVLPDAKIAWSDVWVGAAVTAALFTIGKMLIGLYIGRSDPGSAFGAAGALAVLLVWIYYAAIIVLLGAEFTQAWVKQHGRRIEPEEGAIKIGDGNRAKSGPEKTRPARQDDSIAAAQRELEESRARVAATTKELGAHTSDIAAHAKEKINLVDRAKENPLIALAAAAAAGAAIAALKADEKAADAVKSAAGKAADAAKNVAKDNPATDYLGKQAGELKDELQRGADEIGPR